MLQKSPNFATNNNNNIIAAVVGGTPIDNEITSMYEDESTSVQLNSPATRLKTLVLNKLHAHGGASNQSLSRPRSNSSKNVLMNTTSTAGTLPSNADLYFQVHKNQTHFIGIKKYLGSIPGLGQITDMDLSVSSGEIDDQSDDVQGGGDGDASVLENSTKKKFKKTTTKFITTNARTAQQVNTAVNPSTYPLIRSPAETRPVKEKSTVTISSHTYTTFQTININRRTYALKTYPSQWKRSPLLFMNSNTGKMLDPSTETMDMFEAQMNVFRQEAERALTIPPNERLVPILGCVLEKLAIILDYQPEGSLEDFLFHHQHRDQRHVPELQFLSKVRIMNDVALGMAYLHSFENGGLLIGGGGGVIGGTASSAYHFWLGNIRSSNILLSVDPKSKNRIRARISDYGFNGLRLYTMGDRYYMKSDNYSAYSAPELLQTSAVRRVTKNQQGE